MARKVEIEKFKYKGYDCMIKKIIRNDSFGCRFDDFGLENEWYCGYVVLPKNHKFVGVDYNEDDIYDLTVHGGITYSQYEEKDWVIGFDCIHGGDSILVQNHEYVVNEIISLVEQLIKKEN